MKYSEMSKAQLEHELKCLRGEYESFKAKGLKLDMSRGKPSAKQLDLANGLLDAVQSKDVLKGIDGMDTRNYGGLDGIEEAKKLFSQMIDVGEDEIFVGGNSSLNLMYDIIVKGMLFGFPESEKPWCKLERVKWLCPVPGYDRHFGICENLGIEMINVPMTSTGPDMNEVERLVAEDSAIKGIWCVPMYSNPTGVTYSDETVRRLASMKTKASDFKIFWDNAYCVHHLNDTPDKLISILEECKKAGNPGRVFIFGSTSKVTYAGGGVAVFGADKVNIGYLKKLINVQTIGYDKVNQLRHVRFLKSIDGLTEQMKKQAEQIAPKFNAVIEIFERELAPTGIGSWTAPNGGYFISFEAPDGCAKRIHTLCSEAGVVLTSAGATFPYGKDPSDSNLRIAPTFPPVEELIVAAELFSLCTKLAAVEKLLA